MTFIHEFAHLCATKAVGGEAMMRMSYRYIYIVAETESYHLGVVPRKKRYLVYLAGSIMDLFIVGLLYWVLIATEYLHLNIGQLHNFFIALILSEFLAVIWQFDAFLETDVYNFLSDYLGMENLRNDAIKFIALHTKTWKKVLLTPVRRLLLAFSSDYTKTSDDLRLLNKSERKKLFLYVIVLIAGMTFTTLEFIFYNIPRDYTFIAEALRSIIFSIKQLDGIAILKSTIIVVLVLFDYVLLLLLKNKEIARKQHK